MLPGPGAQVFVVSHRSAFLFDGMHEAIPPLGEIQDLNGPGYRAFIVLPPGR